MSPRARSVLIAVCMVLVPMRAFASDEPPLSIDPSAVTIGVPASYEGKRPVLLIHGTDSSTAQSWTKNYVPALTDAGYAVFTIELPWRALADIQSSSEYVVSAVRTIAGLTGRRIALIGHSQGGLEPQWALTFWPSLRSQVDEVITLATPHHGTEIANLYCSTPCPPADWQMGIGSHFLAALDSRDETPGDIDYTAIYSTTDELVQPQLPTSTSALDGASNVRIQDVCPGRPVNHVGLLRDPVVYALVLDALSHPGPADPSRIPVTTCAQTTIPGIAPADALDPDLQYGESFTQSEDTHATDSEPPVRDYAR